MCSPGAKGVTFLVAFEKIVRPELLGRPWIIDSNRTTFDLLAPWSVEKVEVNRVKVW